MTHKSYQFGPKRTPQVIKALIFITALVSLLGAVLQQWVPIQGLLSLSLVGMKHYFFWQIIRMTDLTLQFTNRVVDFLEVGT